MPFYLPKSMVTTRRFKCPRCSFAFLKDTLSQVEKCPQCRSVVFDRTYREGDSLDPYSAAKLRWYSDESGEYHRDEISRRQLKSDQNGNTYAIVTDEKGRKIDDLPTITVGGNMGKKTNIKQE